RKKVIDFLAKNEEEAKAEIEEWNDPQLRESFLEYNCASETVRSMQFAGGSFVSVSKLGGLYIASDDAGIYGPFETQREAEDSVSFWGYDDVVHDSAHTAEE
ncbi:MAG: hypothetical protein KDN22_34325, partial [Verrucomicrobiae bacterium]|nr:hypothetical protein [Verrucomicrobiae bacterium]